MIQEGKAQKSLEALKSLTSPEATVKRDGIYRKIPAASLVVGDIVSLEAGCQVPADIELISSSSIKLEESALTRRVRAGGKRSPRYGLYVNKRGLWPW